MNDIHGEPIYLREANGCWYAYRHNYQAYPMNAARGALYWVREGCTAQEAIDALNYTIANETKNLSDGHWMIKDGLTPLDHVPGNNRPKADTKTQ